MTNIFTVDLSHELEITFVVATQDSEDETFTQLDKAMLCFHKHAAAFVEVRLFLTIYEDGDHVEEFLLYEFDLD